jgi:CcmD family protein
MENLGYLVAAYGAVFLGIAAYVAWLGAQVSALRHDLTDLRDVLDDQPPGTDGA